MNLHSEFRRLRDEVAPHPRGPLFERLVGRMFSAAKFEVRHHPAVASPRQTDLFVEYDDEQYLVEVKWEDTPAGVPEVDELLTRLRETHPSLVGVLISVRGFTPSAVARVQAKRTRPVLLLDGTELEGLLAGRSEVRRTLRAKRRSLVAEAEVLLQGENGTTRPVADPPSEPAGRVVTPGGDNLPWLTAPGSYSEVVFVQKLADVDWSPSHGQGVTVDLPLGSGWRLESVLGQLGQLGWRSDACRWSVQQIGETWHGVGQTGLLDADARWEERERSTGRLHHTEELRLYDECDGGFYTFSGSVSADRSRPNGAGNLSFQLDGVPVDTAPLRRLADALSVDLRDLRFRSLFGRSVGYASSGRAPVALSEPVALVVEDDRTGRSGEPWVSQVAVLAPTGLVVDALVDQGAPAGLHDEGVWLVALRHQHPVNEPPPGYRLLGAEYASTSDCSCVRVIGDW